MKLFSTLLSVTLLFGTSAQALTLVCTMTKYNNSERFNEQLLKSWIPRKQTHVLDLKTKKSYDKVRNVYGEVDYIDDARIHWRYYLRTIDVRDATFNTTYKYVFLRKRKIFVPTVEINTNYLEMDGVKGTCEERP